MIERISFQNQGPQASVDGREDISPLALGFLMLDEPVDRFGAGESAGWRVHQSAVQKGKSTLDVFAGPQRSRQGRRKRNVLVIGITPQFVQEIICRASPIRKSPYGLMVANDQARN